MNQQNSKKSLIEEKLERVIYEEVSYGIITSLRFHETLNLKRLAQLIGRPETTTIRYLKQLLEDKLIDIDAEKTATSWGKFYRLSKPAKEVMAQGEKEQQQREDNFLSELANYESMSEEKLLEIFVREITNKESLDQIAIQVKHGITLNYNIQKMIINNFIETSNGLTKIKEEKGADYLIENLILDPADINTSTLFIKYSKAKHVMAIIEKFVDFHKAIKELETKFEKEMDKEQIPEDERKTHYVGLFMGTTDFKFQLKKK